MVFNGFKRLKCNSARSDWKQYYILISQNKVLAFMCFFYNGLRVLDYLPTVKLLTSFFIAVFTTLDCIIN